MEIRFISSLTPDDENRIASAVIAAAGSILEHLPIAYMLKIETGSGAVLYHTRRLSATGQTSSANGSGDIVPAEA